jgi:hypothetical protein
MTAELSQPIEDPVENPVMTGLDGPMPIHLQYTFQN